MRLRDVWVTAALFATACAPEALEAPCAGKSQGELYACLKDEGLLADIQAAMVNDPSFLDELLDRMEQSGTFQGPSGQKGDKGDTGNACYDAPDVTDINKDGVLDALDCVGPKGATGEMGPQGKAPTSLEVATAIVDDVNLRNKILKAMEESGNFDGPAGAAGKDGTNAVSPSPKDIGLTFINELDLRQELLDVLDESGLFVGDAGPQGEPGPQGEQGPAGEAGPPGESPSAQVVAQALVQDPSAVAALTGPAGANCWDATGDLNGDGQSNADDCFMKLDGVATTEELDITARMVLKSALCAPEPGLVTGFAPVDLGEGTSIDGGDACVAGGWSTCLRTFQLLNDGSAIAAGCDPGGSGWGADAFACCQL